LNKRTVQKLSLLHSWKLPLKVRLARWLIPTHQKDGSAFFEGVVFANNGCLVNVDTRNFIEYKIFAEGGYENYMSALIKQYLKPNTSFLDVGANIGIHSLSAATITDAQIYAFEPIAFIREKLEKNISLNKYPNIKVVPLALSDEKKVIKTTYSELSSNQGTFSISNEENGTVSINCVKGDDFVVENKISNISVIKIDVEGFEYAVLSGLAETIKNQKPVIFFEFDWKYIGRDNKTIDEYEELVFEKLGYKIFIIEGSILEPCKSLHSLVEMKELMALPKGLNE
jgi:FkbM family methyltransferase